MEKVYVVCINDFPHEVYLDQTEAINFCSKQNEIEKQRKRKDLIPRKYYHYHACNVKKPVLVRQ